MNVELVPLPERERPVLRRLAELYAYDFSEITGRPPGPSGHFLTDEKFESMTAGDKRAFLIRADGEIAGFAIVSPRSFLSADPCVRDVAEFFVLRAYRRKGVGERAACRMFDLFPGAWEVRQVARNLPAQAFWRKVVGRYTAGRFEERWREDPQWHGLVQSFTSAGGE